MLKLFLGDVNQYLSFLSFLHTEIMQVREIIPSVEDKDLPYENDKKT